MKFLFLVSIGMLLVSCVPDSTLVVPTTDTTDRTSMTSTSSGGTFTPSTTTSTTTTPEEYGKVPYYIFQSIITHGGDRSTVVWSSAASVYPHIDDQNIFRTDATLKFRIIAKPSPGKGTDSMGVACKYYAMNYSALKLRLGVRAVNSTTYADIQTFDNLELYKTSTVHTFRPPITNSYFVVDVLGPEWDWYKVNYPDSGQPDWVPVFDNDCIEFEIQMVTDSTYDFN